MLPANFLSLSVSLDEEINFRSSISEALATTKNGRLYKQKTRVAKKGDLETYSIKKWSNT